MSLKKLASDFNKLCGDGGPGSGRKGHTTMPRPGSAASVGTKKERIAMGKAVAEGFAKTGKVSPNAPIKK